MRRPAGVRHRAGATSRGASAAWAHALVAVLAVAAPAAGLAAQDVRGWAQTRVRMVELRPLDRASFPLSAATRLEDGSFVVDGEPVFCSGLTCVRYEAGGVERAVVGTQDVGLTAWGLGVEGLSATTLLRVRGDLAGDLTWPRSDDAFDAILAFAQLDRGPWRARLGRQETLSGLGFSGYDGASLRWGPSRAWALEAYGGRSLARGLNEPRNEALRGLEDFLPDRQAVLLGGLVEARPVDGTAATLRYQREILSDRSGLVSERASLDVRSTLLRPVRLDGSVDWDVAFGRVGKAHLTAQWASPSLPLLLELTGRRYLPYFELSTIWGFFSPVPYHEVGLRAAWAPLPAWEVWGRGAWRAYGDADVTTVLRPLEDRGYRVSVGASGALRPDLAVDARYELDGAVGAFLSSGDVTLAWMPDPRLRVSAGLQSFQQFEEFRLGEGRAWGASLAARAEVTSRVTLDGGVSVLRHDPDGGQVDASWNQTRAWTGLRLSVGEDPGLRARALPGGGTR